MNSLIMEGYVVLQNEVTTLSWAHGVTHYGFDSFILQPSYYETFQNRLFYLHLDFWKSGSWEIKALF